MNKRPFILACSVAACLLVSTAPRLHAQTNGTWSNLAGGSWAASGNWTGGLIADGIGATADFSTLNITANATVTLDGAFTVGTLKFQDITTASNDWILNAGTGTQLTLDVATGPTSIQVLNRVATINAVLASGATPDAISVTGAGTLVLGGANTFSNTLTIGSGMIVSVRLNGALGATGAGNETIVAAGGTLDVQNATANTLNFQSEIVQISGFGVGNAGAITDTGGATQTAALGTVILNANSSIGGSVRWDIRGAGNSLNLNGFRLTKVGANTIAMTPGTITEGLIDITAGTVSIEGASTTTQGNGTITVANGGNLGVWATGAGLFTRPIALAGGAIVEQGQTTTPSTLNSGIVLTSNSTINTGSGGTGAVFVTLAGDLAESGGQFGITKTGNNALNFNAAANFTGALAVNAGSIVLGSAGLLQSKLISLASGASFNSSAVGGFTLGSGGSFTVGRSGGGVNDVVGNFATSAGTILSINAGAAAHTATFANDLALNSTILQHDIGSSAVDSISVAGALNVTGTNPITLRPYGTVGITPGTYNLITYGTGGGITATSFSLANASDFRQSITLVNPATTPGSVQVAVSGSNANLVWLGDGAANRWDVNGAATWKNVAADKFYQLDKVTFDDTSTNGTVDVSVDVAPSDISVNATKNYTIGGVGRITSSTGLTKSGTGKVTLTNLQNTFLGPVTINAGTVSGATLANAGAASAFGAGSLIVLDGGRLEYTGTNLGTSRTITIGNGLGDGTISVTNPLATLNVTTALAGSGRLIKDGAGALRVDANVTFAGDILVNGGILRANSNTAFGTKSITVSPGATFDPNGQTGAGSRPVLNIAGFGAPGQAAIWNAGGAQTNTPLYGTINLTADASLGSNVRYDLNGGTGGVTVNTGTFTLTKTGWGETWWAPNGGAVVGSIVIEAGRLGIQSSSNLGTSTAPIIVNPGGELSSFSTVTNDKAIVLNGGNFGNNNDATTATWTGGLTVNASSFLGGNGNVTTRIFQFSSPTFSLGGNTLTKINRETVNISGATGGTGPGNFVVLGGQVTINDGSLINGTGVLALKADGTVTLDNSLAPVTLSKATQFDGGLLISQNGSRTIGPVTVSGHGRITNNTAATTLTIPNLTVPANSGITLLNIGDIVITNLNGSTLSATPFRLPAGFTAGPGPAALLPAAWDGTKVVTIDPTDFNFAAPTATSIELVNSAPTLASDTTVDTLVAEGTMNINNGALLQLNGGTLILRGSANFSITTSTAGTPGRLTSSAPSGDLQITEGVNFGTAGGDSGIRIRLVDNPVAGGGLTPMRLVKEGPGSLVDLGFDGTNGFDNTYSGGTVINNGRIPISSSNALGTGPVTIRDGGQVAFFNSTGVRGNFLSNNFNIAGTGGGENNGPFGAIRLGIASQTFSVISGNIVLDGSARIHNQNTNDGILAGVISGPSTATLTKTGGNVVLLSNPSNSYLGVTEIGARDQTASGAINVMRLANGGSPSSLGASSNAASNVLIQANGVLRYVGPGDSTDRLFTLGNSFGFGAVPTTTIETIGYGSLNFTNPGTLAITPGSYRTLILSAPASTLGIWLNGGLRENTFAPVLGDPIQGFGQLQKNGAGKWILTSNQAYNGTTTVADGVLQIGNGSTSGMVGTGVITLQGNGDLVVKRSDSVVINNPINGVAAADTEVVQVGTGTTTLGGGIDNSSLKVRVESGRLVLGKESNSIVHAAAIQITVNGGILQLGGTGGDQIFDGGATGNAATTVFMNGGTFDTNGRSEGLSRIEGIAGVISNSASGTVSTLTVGTGNVSSFIGIGSAMQDGTGVFSLAKTGTGTIAITGDGNTYTGGTTVNQGWLMIGNGGPTGSLPGAVVVNQGGSLVVNRSNVYTLPNAISGTGDLLQAGTGTTILGSPLNYQGATVVGLGELQVNLAAGNNILPTLADLRLNGGGITFVGGSGGSSAQTIAGGFTVAGGDIRVNATAGATALNLPSVWSRTTGGSVNFATTGTASINSAIANVGGIIGTPTTAYATLNGMNWAAQSGTNSVAAFSAYTPNSYNIGTHTDVTADFAFAGTTTTDTVRFNAAAALDLGLDSQLLVLNRAGILVTPGVGANAITISNGTVTGANSPASEVIVHQHNTAMPATISAVVANNGTNSTALTKAGPGTLILANTNTYSGGTHVNQGVLQVGNGGTTGALGQGVVQNDATLVFNRSDTYTFTNPISGFGSVVKSGSGILNLRGNGSFTGGLIVSQGTVATDSPSALGVRTVTLGDANSGANNVALFSDFGGDIPNNIVVSNAGTGTAILGSSSSGIGLADPSIYSGIVVLNRATTFQGGNTDRTTFTGVISGNPGTLTFTTGRTTFEAENTYVATDLVVQGGATLQVGTGSVAFPRSQVPDTANVTLNGNGVFQLNGDSEIVGQLNSTSTTSLVQAAGSGPTVLTVANGGTFNGAFNGTANGGMTLEAIGGTLTLGGTTDNNTGRLLVNGGTMVLAKTSTASVHAGAIDVTVNSGVLRLGGTGGDQIYDGSATSRTNVVINGGTFDLNGLNEAFSELNGFGGVVTNTSTTPAALTLGTNNWSNSGYYGTLQDGAGTLSLTKTGAGGLILGGSNTYTGVTTISAGILQLGNGGAGGSIASASIVDNGQLVSNRSDDFTIAGAISGAGRFVQNGSGRTTLSGANTYTGSTTVNAGQLLLDSSATIGSGNVTVNGLGTLGGLGSIAGAVTVNGGTLAPGLTIGTLNTGPLSFLAGSALSLDIGGTTGDLANVTGSVSLSGSILMTVALTADPVDLTSFTIINSSAGINGYSAGARFVYLGNSLDEGEQFAVSSGAFSQIFSISYVADAGKDVVLMAVPEPGALASLLGGTGLLIGLRRFRRR